MIKLPFNLDMNAPLSKVIYQPSFTRKKTNFTNSLAYSLNRLVIEKLKNALFNIKYEATKNLNPKSYSNISNKKKSRMFRLLNLKINSIVNDFWYKFKVSHLNSKKEQQQNSVKESLKQTFDYVLPIIEERILMYSWRKLIKYVKCKQNKQKLIIQTTRTIQKLTRRNIYSSAFLMIRLSSQNQIKKLMALQKIFNRLKQKLSFYNQLAFRKIQIYYQSAKLDQIHAQKKAKVSKIYDVNAQRGNMLQNQRQILRNLKNKLDYDSVQKNHIITDKRRQIMLAKSKFNEEQKQLQQEIRILQSQTTILELKFNKEKQIYELLQADRTINKKINFQKISKQLYSVITELFTDGKLSTLLEIFKNYQIKLDQHIILMDNIQNNPSYQLKLIAVLEMFIKYYQRKEDISGSKVKVSTAKAGLGNITLNINSSKFSNVAPIVKKTQQPQYQRVKDQNKGICQLIQFLLEKEYETSMDINTKL